MLYYYGVVLLVLLVFNLIVTPLLLKEEVTEVDYGTFMSMTEDKNIGQVQVEDQQIVFTDKDEKNVYKTNAMDDPQLTERLYESGAKFSKDVDASTSPLLSLLITESCRCSSSSASASTWQRSSAIRWEARTP